MNDRQPEIEKRRPSAAANEKKFSIVRLPSHVVEKFQVTDESGTAYQVMLDRDMNLKSCECHDFLKAGLGTCKHIEAVLRQSAPEAGASTPENPNADDAPPKSPAPTAPPTDFQLTSPEPSTTRTSSATGVGPGGRHRVCFDVETQNSFEDVGGRQNFGQLRVSVGVVFDEALNQYLVYQENEMPQMIDHLFAADLVIGYNIMGFDYPVIQPYSSRRVKSLPTLDLMNELAKKLGFRVKLDSVVHATLGAHKSGHGLQAIQWFRAGEMRKLIQYCQDDVRLTYDLYRFGAQNGFVYIDSRGSRRRVLVDWK